jgi:hypothetical protein
MLCSEEKRQVQPPAVTLHLPAQAAEEKMRSWQGRAGACAAGGYRPLGKSQRLWVTAASFSSPLSPWHRLEVHIAPLCQQAACMASEHGRLMKELKNHRKGQGKECMLAHLSAFSGTSKCVFLAAGWGFGDTSRGQWQTYWPRRCARA